MEMNKNPRKNKKRALGSGSVSINLDRECKHTTIVIIIRLYEVIFFIYIVVQEPSHEAMKLFLGKLPYDPDYMTRRHIL